jgi:hypothetical protein
LVTVAGRVVVRLRGRAVSAAKIVRVRRMAVRVARAVLVVGVLSM